MNKNNNDKKFKSTMPHFMFVKSTSYYVTCSKCKKKIPRGKESKTKDGKFHCFDCVMSRFMKDFNKKVVCKYKIGKKLNI